MNVLQNKVYESIKNAEVSKSKLNEDILSIQGFTSRRIKHFLNNLCDGPYNYLEIGVHKGSTFISANFMNNLQSSIAVDNWADFDELGKSKRDFIFNITRFLKKDSCLMYEQDCFTIEKNQIPNPIDIYFYDGPHDEADQFRALEYFLPMLADQFIFICDDWNWKEVQEGTRRAIRELDLGVIMKKELVGELKNGEFNSNNSWWNGIYVSVLMK